MAFETFEHTADLGLRIAAATLSELYAEAGVAFFSLLVEDLETVRPQRKTRLHIEVATDGPEEEWRANLLVDWLGELLFRFEHERQLFCRFEASLGEKGLDVEAWGEAIDPTRHELDLDVKAITYHGLFVREVGKQFEAEVILDL